VDPGRTLDQAIAALNRPGAALPLEDVDRALKVAPSDPRLWHVKGLIHREQERRELALPALERAVQLAPREPLIVHGLARTLLEAGRPSSHVFAQAMKLSPSNPEVVTGMVAALIAEGQTAAAIEGLEVALRRSPLWIPGHILLSELRWSEGVRDGFAASFHEALAEHPNSIDLRRELMNALLHAERFSEVLDLVQDSRRRSGDARMFIVHEATAYSELGQVEIADGLFAQLPLAQDSSFDMRRVRHLLFCGRPKEAADVLEHWLDTDEQAIFWPYAASAWRMSGDSRSAWLEEDERLVGTYDIADGLPPLEKLATTLRRLHTSKSQPLVQSVRGGTQTDGHLFQRIEPEIVELREAIRRAVAQHVEQLPPVDPKHPTLRFRPREIAFTGAWSVRLTGGGYHANHVHPMGWLSSALYLVLPPDLGREDAGWLVLGEPQAQLKIDLPPHRMIEPKPGRLALFPSWMWHGTRPFGEGERMTVAFDVAQGG
jgi:tetratricopeptide (TPR) repeat protein